MLQDTTSVKYDTRYDISHGNAMDDKGQSISKRAVTHNTGYISTARDVIHDARYVRTKKSVNYDPGFKSTIIYDPEYESTFIYDPALKNTKELNFIQWRVQERMLKWLVGDITTPPIATSQ